MQEDSSLGHSSGRVLGLPLQGLNHLRFGFPMARFVDSLLGGDHYSYLAYCSSEAIITISTSGRACCWFAESTCILKLVGILIDNLPPLIYSLDAPPWSTPAEHAWVEWNHERGYHYTVYSGCLGRPTGGGLNPKMAFYAEHFMELRDSLIVRPPYTFGTGCMLLGSIPLGQFRVGSHWIRVETGHHITWGNRICQFCHLHTEEHFIFWCPIYYEITGWFLLYFNQESPRPLLDLTSSTRWMDTWKRFYLKCMERKRFEYWKVQFIDEDGDYTVPITHHNPGF